MQQLRVAITGGTSGLGLALVRELSRPRRARRLHRTAPRRRGTRRPRTARGQRHRRRRVAQGRHPSDRDTGAWRSRRTRRPHQQRLVAWPGAARRRWRTPTARTWSCALATNLLGPFRLTKALLGSLAASAREGRHPLVVNVSSDAAVTAVRRVGRLRRQQGCAPSSQPDLERGARARRNPRRVHRSRRYGHAAARARRPRRRSLDAEEPGCRSRWRLRI